MEQEYLLKNIMILIRPLNKFEIFNHNFQSITNVTFSIFLIISSVLLNFREIFWKLIE